MQVISDVLRTVDQEIQLGWQRSRDWADRVFTRERIADITMVVSTVTILAAVLFVLSRAVRHHTIERVSPYISSLDWQLGMPGY
jgi:hypothetical protein